MKKEKFNTLTNTPGKAQLTRIPLFSFLFFLFSSEHLFSSEQLFSSKGVQSV